jgi:formylglycine-generating enzyme required for sulfatase activity
MLRKVNSSLLVVSLAAILSACHGQAEKVRQFATQQLNDMVFVQDGSFMMGPGAKEAKWVAPNNQPRHKVTLSSYYMSKYLVTYGDFDRYTESTGLPMIDKDGYKLKAFNRNAKHPVTTVTWQQANNYCQYLAQKTGLPFDLPTEAQWEYAARSRGLEVNDATNTGTSIFGENTPDAQQLENQPGNVVKLPFPMEVGKFPPNPLGLYDMTGSVYQWMKNWYYNYTSSAKTDPQGPKTGSKKMVRGGGIDVNEEAYIGVYARLAVDPTMKNEVDGFRCVINSEKPMSELQKIAAQHLQ